MRRLQYIHVENELDLDRKALYAVTESYGFIQLVKQPTHQDGGILDLVFSQEFNKFHSSICNTTLLHDLCFSVTSDHKFIEFIIEFYSPMLYKLKLMSFHTVNLKRLMSRTSVLMLLIT